MEPLAETFKLLEPYSDMDISADELETATINSLFHRKGGCEYIYLYVYPLCCPKGNAL